MKLAIFLAVYAVVWVLGCLLAEFCIPDDMSKPMVMMVGFWIGGIGMILADLAVYWGLMLWVTA